MVKVENRETLRLLTSRFMRMNRGRNAMAVIAILLTCLLFTSIFMGTASLILSKRATDIRQFMSSSHAVAQDLSDEEAQKLETALEKSNQVQRWGSGIFLGPALHKKFAFSAEVRSADKNLAESFNCLPSQGRMPEQEHEIAVSTLILDALQIPHELGQKVTLTWEKDPVSGKKKTDTFRLCGFWKGDKAVLSQIAWVSPSYAEKNRYPVTAKQLSDGYMNGGRDCAVWYKNLWNLRDKTREIREASGAFGKDSENRGLEVNPAYDMEEEDSFSFASVGIMILFIILAGYLIIYNIFSLSVKNDIRAYGLLKNVGTTGKQLKKIVRMQALRLSAAGIPLGLLLGYGAGVLMAPALTSTAEISANAAESTETVVSANPLLFLAATFFTLLTVYLSSIQACRMVEKVSPVEALRLAESDKSSRASKKNSSVTWYGMAFQNMLRNWKKGIIVMLSIAISMVVMNSIVMLVQGYDFDSYKEIFLASDFQLDQTAGDLRTSNLAGITPDIKKELDACPDKKSAGYVYYSDETHAMETSLKKIWEENAKKYQGNWNSYENEVWKKTKASGKITVHFLGISESVFDKLQWRGKPCTWNEFKDGNSVIVDYNDKYAEQPSSYYKRGESFRMECRSGESKTYKICGEALMPYSLDYPYADLIYLTVLVPESEFIRCTGQNSAMCAAVDAKKGREKQVQQYIRDTVLQDNDMINVFSILDMRASFQRYINKFYIIGGSLAAILAFIGIMNFFNTTATSILSRKKELALLEVVGMTKKQISKMLAAEGCIYLGGAFITAVLILCLFAEKLLVNTVGKTFFFQMHLNLIPCILMLPALFLIAWLLPKHQFRRMSRESVVARIRQE